MINKNKDENVESKSDNCIQPLDNAIKLEKIIPSGIRRESIKYPSLCFLVPTYSLQLEIQAQYNNTQVHLENSEDSVC